MIKQIVIKHSRESVEQKVKNIVKYFNLILNTDENIFCEFVIFYHKNVRKASKFTFFLKIFPQKRKKWRKKRQNVPFFKPCCFCLQFLGYIWYNKRTKTRGRKDVRFYCRFRRVFL